MKVNAQVTETIKTVSCTEGDAGQTVVEISAHGGARQGAGRPATGRTQRKLRATDEEWALIKKYADEVRAK